MKVIKEEDLFQLRLEEEVTFYGVGEPYAYHAFWDEDGNKIYLADYDEVEETEMMTGKRPSHRVIANVYFPGEEKGRLLDTYFKYIFPIMENIPKEEQRDYDYYKEMSEKVASMDMALRIRVVKDPKGGVLRKHVEYVEGDLTKEFKKELLENAVDLKELIKAKVEETKRLKELAYS